MSANPIFAELYLWYILQPNFSEASLCLKAINFKNVVRIVSILEIGTLEEGLRCIIKMFNFRT